MRRPLLALSLFATVLVAADPASLRDLVAAQKARAAACEEGLRALATSCGQGSPKEREARILHRKAQERTNSLAEALLQEVKAGGPEPTGKLQEAEAATSQLQAYLDLARCDGTTAAPPEDAAVKPVLPELPRLLKAALDGGSRKQVADQLEGLRWSAVPAGAVGKSAEVDALAPRFLRMKGTFHTAPIRQMAMDAHESVVVTASEDKTIRVWDPRTLECQQVLHPPMGPGDCGKLYAVALSPDGRTLVASGFTRDAEGGGHRLYVMDVRDGRLIREIPGLPQVVNRLTLSPDGTTVVVHLGERMGLRRYRLADGVELGRDPLFGGPSYFGAFAPDGRFACTSDDGLIRVYSPAFKLLGKVPAPAHSPFGIAFSPDGARLAVGYAEGCRVDILSSKNLFPAGKVDTAGCAGPLDLVAWSQDGGRLFAGGGQDFGPSPNKVYAWAEAGKGARTEVALASATLGELLPLKDGGLLVAAQDPKVCRLGADLAVKAAEEMLPGSMGQARDGLRVDAAGGTVALGWRFAGRPDSAFSFTALGLQNVKDGLLPPLRDLTGLKVADWQDGEKPTLNGAPLQGLEPHEVVRSLSLARNGQTFALGTDWCLRVFDSGGRLAQTVSLPAACWGLNHTPDGKLLVAALADGTVRWYRAGGDGGELMALTLSSDGQRWVLWNPEGYYATSVGGEGLLGWQVQREGEAGDFFPLSHFRKPYLQPLLFPALIAQGDLNKALGSLGLAQPVGSHAQEAAMTLPPVVRILEPREGSAITPGTRSFKVGVRCYGPDEPARTWHLYVDGEKLADQAGAKPLPRQPEAVETEYLVDVPLPSHACKVSLVMESEARVSEPANVNLVEPVAAPAAAPSKAPVLNIVSIGVSNYREGSLKLTYPAKDARDVVGLFQGQQNRLYSNVKVHTLVDGEATRTNILKVLRDVRDASSPWDVTLLFLSGHGSSNPGVGSYCFLPYEADPHDEATLVDGREIREILARTQGKVVLMLDTCHSGNVLGEGKMRGLDEAIKLTRFINELTSADNGVMVFSSSTGRQLSLEAPEWGNGAFTKALREGLGEGKADPGHSGAVTLVQLDTWLRGRVKDLTLGTQTPVTARPTTALDFPLVILP